MSRFGSQDLPAGWAHILGGLQWAGRCTCTECVHVPGGERNGWVHARGGWDDLHLCLANVHV